MRTTTPCDWRTGALLVITAMTVGTSAASVDACADRNASSETVTVRASDEFDHNGIWRMLFGNAWRDVWTAEITVPVLDLGSYAGGLKPIKAGGNQSRTLRLKGADGRTYVFRSTQKNVNKVLPDDLKDTPASAVASDQRATFHPTGHGVVTELLHAVGVLHTVPTLVYIPDDPRLGEFREDFANTLGQIEERPDENEKGPAFAGAEKIIGADKLLENLEESLENRVDSREYLAARMIDFMVGDTDRGADQWRFAKFERDETDVYRPIPRDNDYAFMKVEGLAATVGRRVYPRLVCFGEKHSKMRSLLFMTQEFDRSHLIELDWPEWEKVVATIQLRLTDYVIERAVADMPEAHQELSAPLITAGLRARRDALRDIAHDYYLLINREADVFGSDEDETAEIDRNADGSVRVRMWRRTDDGGVTAGARVFRAGLSDAPAVRGDELVFERLFVPDETHEIRVYLERGDDRAVVRGVSHRSIDVRVTGGEGDDVLADSSHLERGARTRFYDATGENTFVTGSHTHVDTTPFVTKPPRRSLDEDENQEPEEHPRRVNEERRGRFRDLMPGSEDVIERQMYAGQRFWGSTGGLMVMTGYRESGGVLLGLGPTTTHYGFRHQPYAWRADARGILGTRNGGFAVQAATDRYFENSLWRRGTLRARDRARIKSLLRLRQRHRAPRSPFHAGGTLRGHGETGSPLRHQRDERRRVRSRDEVCRPRCAGGESGCGGSTIGEPVIWTTGSLCRPRAGLHGGGRHSAIRLGSRHRGVRLSSRVGRGGWIRRGARAGARVHSHGLADTRAARGRTTRVGQLPLARIRVHRRPLDAARFSLESLRRRCLRIRGCRASPPPISDDLAHARAARCNRLHRHRPRLDGR